MSAKATSSFLTIRMSRAERTFRYQHGLRRCSIAAMLIGFICNIAHHADVGGMVPGSMAGGMSEIYQEGLRLPVVRLFRKGVLQEDLFNLILLNVRVSA